MSKDLITNSQKKVTDNQIKLKEVFSQSNRNLNENTTNREISEQLSEKEIIRPEVAKQYKRMIIAIALVWTALFCLMIWFGFEWAFCNKCLVSNSNNTINSIVSDTIL